MTEQQQPYPYPVGSIVNGHVWTGTAWVPTQAVPAKPPRAPLSTQFQQLSAIERWAIIVGGLVVGALVVFIGSEMMRSLGL